MQITTFDKCKLNKNDVDEVLNLYFAAHALESVQSPIDCHDILQWCGVDIFEPKR